jgi:hypothetical protein
LLHGRALPNKIGKHLNERGVVVDRGGSMKTQALFLCHPSCLYIQVVQHLYVLTLKSDWHDNHIFQAILG